MMKTIGFLGCGNMGGAIARAVCKATESENVFLANRTAAKAEALAAELGCQTATNAEVAGDCDLIFLAVKPQMMEAMLEPLRFILAERSNRFVLCTMAAGLPVARIQEMAGGDYPVIRIMPNTPASVGEGMIQYCSVNVTAEEEEAFCQLLAPAGRLDAVAEGMIDAASCVSGCGRWRRGLRSAPGKGTGVRRTDGAGQRKAGAGKRQAPRCAEGRCVQPRRQHHSGRAGTGRTRAAWCGDGCRAGRLRQNKGNGKGLMESCASL